MWMAGCRKSVFAFLGGGDNAGNGRRDGPHQHSTIHNAAMSLPLPNLLAFARDFAYREAELPIHYSAEPYTRVPIHRDEHLEIVVICFAAGQTSSVHDHQGSNCVIRVVRGKVMECLFARTEGELQLDAHHYLRAGEISGLDGRQSHQLSNLDPEGTVLLNFYSPPFKM
jgi:predicted metal-dependent enzyme (double-stranded beta helix superfamily)